MSVEARPSPYTGRSFLSSIIPQGLFGSRNSHAYPGPGDEEGRIAHDHTFDSQTPGQGPQRVSSTRLNDALVDSQDKLALFRSLVGIHNPEILHIGSFFRSARPAPNVGIYERVIKSEAKAHRDYKLFSFLISFCLGAQILVAACLTALGAGHGPHSAVTVFGAINTVFSGFLAYLKGSGLPNRLKYYENEWTKVREYIEQREREFCRQNCPLNPEIEIDTIERMYEDVKRDVEANTPDSFISVRDVAKRGGGVNPAPSLASPPSKAIDAAADRIHDRITMPTEKEAASLRRNLSYQSSHLGREISQYGEKIHGYDEQAAALREKAASYGEKLHNYGDQAAALKDKAMGLGDKAVGFEEKVSGLADRPYSIDVTVSGHRSEPALNKAKDEHAP